MPRAWTTRTSGGQVSFSSSSSSIFQSPIRFLLCFEFLTPNSVNFASSRSVHISPSYFLFTPSSPSSTHWIISLLRSPAPIFNSFLNDQFTPPLSYLVNFSILIPTFLSILFPPSNPIYPLIRISAPSHCPISLPKPLIQFYLFLLFSRPNVLLPLILLVLHHHTARSLHCLQQTRLQVGVQHHVQFHVPWSPFWDAPTHARAYKLYTVEVTHTHKARR